MTFEKYRDWNPKTETLELVATCNDILDELSDYRLTLRQLYYQLVTRNIIPNQERAYKKLGKTLTRARLAGLVDWDAIEDRVRQPVIPTEFEDLEDLVEAALRSYRLPRWRDQRAYVELWVEKDALASVLRPLADQFHVTLMVNRGYSSASAMKEAAERFREYHVPRRLFYLGDLDPSGEDMVRDIRDRLAEFRANVRVEKIALTIDQVEEYEPPPNPAKLTDSRAAEFVARYGTSSWEVDALPPSVLGQIITDAISGSITDDVAMREVVEEEKRDKERLREAVKELV